MAEVEFVFELLSPEPQERAEQLLQPPRRRLQPFDLMFLEDPVPPENVEAMAKVTAATSIPICTASGWAAATMPRRA